MPPPAPPLVLLDLDGTLTDSAPGILASARAAFKSLGLPIPSDTELLRFIGPPIPESFRAFGIPGRQIPDAIAAYRTEFTAGAMYDNRVYDGVPEQLRILREAGCSLAVATSKPEIYARPICDRFGITDLVDGVYGAPLDEVPSSKAAVIAHALEELGARGLVPDPAEIVMVGDRHHDVEGAAAHGVPCVGVGWGYAEPGELAGAVVVINSVGELAETALARLKTRR